MKKGIYIKNWVQDTNNLEVFFEEELEFFEWEQAEKYLKDRIQIIKTGEFFFTQIGSKKIGEFNKFEFPKINQIRDLFFAELEKESTPKKVKNNAERKTEKLARIEIRIEKELKEKVQERCKENGITISDYTRELYQYQNFIQKDEQLIRNIRGMSINLNQIAKKINGGSISDNQAIEELRNILSELKKSLIR